MPRIIENVREQLLAETKRQIAENGYAKTTVRSVAAACGLGVGTVYNYFSSKEMLIGTFMLEDWQECVSQMKSCSSEKNEEFLGNICRALRGFISGHQKLFSDSDAIKVFMTVFTERHHMLREQMAQVIAPLCERASHENKSFLADFIAESILTWTAAGKPDSDIIPVLCLLLK